MLIRERVCAQLPGEFVVFLIGMRINNPLLLHKWIPVASAMPRMIEELSRQPELGLLHAESWFSRTMLMVQYWRSMEQLLSYATNREAEHLPAWRRSTGRSARTERSASGMKRMASPRVASSPCTSTCRSSGSAKRARSFRRPAIGALRGVAWARRRLTTDPASELR
jgi:hypothetical protein